MPPHWRLRCERLCVKIVIGQDEITINLRCASACRRMASKWLAEGVVSAPFLPSGDQSRKDGFAPFYRYHTKCTNSLSFTQQNDQEH